MTFPATDNAIYQKLKANANLLNAVGTVSGLIQIYNTDVPDSATLPYVVFYNVSTPTDLTLRTATDELWTVEGVASSASSARNLETYIVEALHNQELTYTGWSNYHTFIVDRRYFVDREDKNAYHRRIVDVNIRWSEI